MRPAIFIAIGTRRPTLGVATENTYVSLLSTPGTNVRMERMRVQAGARCDSRTCDASTCRNPSSCVAILFYHRLVVEGVVHPTIGGFPVESVRDLRYGISVEGIPGNINGPDAVFASSRADVKGGSSPPEDALHAAHIKRSSTIGTLRRNSISDETEEHTCEICSIVLAGIQCEERRMDESETVSMSARTCLWCDSEGAEAASLVVSLRPDSQTRSVHRTNSGQPMLPVEIMLARLPYNSLNGSPHDPLISAASTSVLTGDQEETDLLWSAWNGGGGSRQRRGTLVGCFQLSWRIIPTSMSRPLLIGDNDADARDPDAIMTKTRTRTPVLESAFHGEGRRVHVELC